MRGSIKKGEKKVEKGPQLQTVFLSHKTFFFVLGTRLLSPCVNSSFSLSSSTQLNKFDIRLSILRIREKNGLIRYIERFEKKEKAVGMTDFFPFFSLLQLFSRILDMEGEESPLKTTFFSWSFPVEKLTCKEGTQPTLSFSLFFKRDEKGSLTHKKKWFDSLPFFHTTFR